jgi:hypothetical protein
MTEETYVPLTAIHRVQADGVTVFYREAGDGRGTGAAPIRRNEDESASGGFISPHLQG